MSPESKILVDQDGTPFDPTGGFETEYGYEGSVHLGDEVVDTVSAGRLLLASGRGYVTVSKYGTDGGRQYIDHEHPEYCTAEDIVVLNAAYRVLYGHGAMADDLSAGARAIEAKEAAAGNPVRIEVGLYTNTVDTYGNSWGRHMNILAPRALMPEMYIPALVAHHASRIVWSGAGYVAQRGEGFHYCLSEKAELIKEESNNETTRSRPLVNLRDEPLANKDLYRRIHDVSGESVFSPQVMALQLASEAIILKACGLGVSFDDLKPVDGAAAIKTISNDPTLKAKVQLMNGFEVTGIELQQLIAERAIGAVEHAKLMTEQDATYKVIWLNMLDDLIHGRFTDASGKVHKFDWVVKRRRIDAGLRSKTKKASDYETAVAMSKEYHRILSKEGPGMRLVRAGAFVDSPSAEILATGPELPPTRAGLRARTIGRLIAAKANYVVDWDHLKLLDGTDDDDDELGLLLGDPFATEDHRVERLLGSIAA